MTGKVSFLIAAYNEQDFILECIESCLTQSYKEIEVVVVDDGSTDKTSELVRGLSDDRVKFSRFEVNRGKVAAYNFAFSMSTGAYISLVGADDVNERDRVERSIRTLREGNFDLVVGDLEACDVNMNPISVIPAARGWDIFDLMVGNRLAGGAIFFRREFAKIVFPIPEQLRFEDWWIGFIASLRGRCGYVNFTVTRYRQHDSNDIGLAGSTTERRIKDWRRHDAYYLAFHDYLKNNKDISSVDLLAQLDACRRLKKMYLAEGIWERMKVGFVWGRFPRGLKGGSLYLTAMLFGRRGYDLLVDLRRSMKPISLSK
ncbi:glycosyltransferase [Cupriavidus basilensis]|uniref:glycosyltransferase n=1 Tax=Cupriavidus basilensis TaxID=68895 RepID=UPI0020A6A25E|nr:glycosyltransferase [Cupriavidus basilensis]MCP3019500.1 glycosyltransferase [Cupriavidus basilensis]